MNNLGENIKKLGFGLMRLPMKDEKIDIEQTKVMVDKFLDAGFTYFDTAWAYAGSEDAIRQALVERYPRESYQLATKNAAWINCNTRDEAISQFETSLKQTGAGYFDFYQRKERRRVNQTYWFFIPFNTRRVGRNIKSTPRDGVCTVTNKLCRLGKSSHSVESML